MLQKQLGVRHRVDVAFAALICNHVMKVHQDVLLIFLPECQGQASGRETEKGILLVQLISTSSMNQYGYDIVVCARFFNHFDSWIR